MAVPNPTAYDPNKDYAAEIKRVRAANPSANVNDLIDSGLAKLNANPNLKAQYGGAWADLEKQYRTVPAPPTMTSTTSVNTSNPTKFADWQAKQNDMMNKYETMLNTPFNFNAETDPGYQAQRQLAHLRAGDATRNALETMNDRGIVNSTVTASQLGEIQQRAEQEAASYIPQYRSEAYGRYQDQLRNAAEMLNFATGRTDRFNDTAYRDERAARGDFESDRTFDYNTSPNNPANQAQVIENQINQLKLQNLPEELKLNLEQLRQNVATGKLDYQQAQFQLDELTNPNSVTNRARALSLEADRLGNVELRKRIDQIGKEPVLSPEEKRMQAIKLEQAELELQQMKNPQTTTATKPTTVKEAQSLINGGMFISKDFSGAPHVTDPEKLSDFIFSLDMPENETRQLFQLYGLKWGD